MALFGLGGKNVSEWSQVTQTPQKADWTHFLSSEAVGILRSVLEAAYRHRQAYFKADDIKNAQLWSALIEIQRQINEINAKMANLPRETASFRLGTPRSGTVLEKIRAVMQPSVEDTKEATNALVNSLMKF